jgi:hypothetical protein
MYIKRKIRKKIKDEIRKGTDLVVACKKAGITFSGFSLWGKTNPRQKQWHKMCVHYKEDIQIDAVESAHRRKMLSGKAHPADYIFYLCNKRPDKWKRQENTVLNVSQTNTQYTVKIIQDDNTNRERDRSPLAFKAAGCIEQQSEI